MLNGSKVTIIMIIIIMILILSTQIRLKRSKWIFS